jgi:NADPH2:quinone reductase
MKAHIIENFGTTDVFRKVELPRPKVKPLHVLVRVVATSVNPLDCKIRSGLLGTLSPKIPAILHGDLAGIVEEVGEGTSFQPGDEVFGFVGGVTDTQGVLGEYVLVDQRLISKKPKSLSFKEAAALPLVGITAWEALVDRTKIKLGDRVLIHAGAGGTGHIGIQLAKLQGASVYATVSSEEKAEIAKSMGADEVIYYTRESVKEYVKKHTGGQGFDVILDTVGGDVLTQSFDAAAVGGQVASIMTLSSHDLSLLLHKGLSFNVIFMLIPLIHNRGREHHGEIMRKLASLADSNQLKPWIDSHEFTFTDVSKAHFRLESGRALGKVVLSQDSRL